MGESSTPRYSAQLQEKQRERERAHGCSVTKCVSHLFFLWVDQFSSQQGCYLMSNIIPKHNLGPCGNALFIRPLGSHGAEDYSFSQFFPKGCAKLMDLLTLWESVIDQISIGPYLEDWWGSGVFQVHLETSMMDLATITLILNMTVCLCQLLLYCSATVTLRHILLQIHQLIEPFIVHSFSKYWLGPHHSELDHTDPGAWGL